MHFTFYCKLKFASYKLEFMCKPFANGLGTLGYSLDTYLTINFSKLTL